MKDYPSDLAKPCSIGLPRSRFLSRSDRATLENAQFPPRFDAGDLAESRRLCLEGMCLMARWPDDRKANLIAVVLVFILFPLLCWLSWRWLTQT